MREVPIRINRCGLSFTDRVVFITGGAKGIGAGCARVFVDAGATAVIYDRDGDAGACLASQLTSKGPGQCHFIEGDVAVETSLSGAIDKAAELFGRLDSLVNNAGVHPDVKRIRHFTVDELHRTLQTNLISCFVASRQALPYLRKTKGSITNIGSLAGSLGEAGSAVYCASKAAISGFTKALAVEEALSGVRVNVVLPGNIVSWGRVAIAAQMENGDEWEEWLDSHQVTGRSGTVEEVGQLCLFLATEAASYLTGIEIVISGGSELGYGVKYPPNLPRE